ncbi:hypothetical protein RJT34_11897 [Clitoria ternatea]|uniref:Uncharacterized protein n=1 Tax=Clitoria ternatea TaxID=43366 RepID=A0AAN9PJZ0_CLITE
MVLSVYLILGSPLGGLSEGWGSRKTYKASHGLESDDDITTSFEEDEDFEDEFLTDLVEAEEVTWEYALALWRAKEGSMTVYI